MTSEALSFQPFRSQSWHGGIQSSVSKCFPRCRDRNQHEHRKPILLFRLGKPLTRMSQQSPGENEITLRGRLIPHNGSDSELAIVSQLFTQYINSESSPVIAIGQSTLQNDNSTISWLSQGLQALQLTVPLKPFTPINPIRSIDIGYFGLAFSESQPWAPVAHSRTVQASLRRYLDCS